MADQTQRLEIATVRAEIGSNILYRFSNDSSNDESIPTSSGDIKNLKKIILEIQSDAASKISVSTTIYPNVAKGLEATPDQSIFLVQSNEDTEIYSVWQNVSGAAVNTGKTALSATAVESALEQSEEAARLAGEAADKADLALVDIEEISSKTALYVGESLGGIYSHEFVDQNNFIVAGISPDGVGFFSGSDFGSGKTTQGEGAFEIYDKNRFVIGRIGATQSFLGGMHWRNTESAGIEICDDYGFILARYDNSAPVHAGVTIPSPIIPRLNRQQRTQIMLIIGYGQSLSRGINSLPAISTTQPYNNIMIASGTKIRNGDSGYNPSSFVPLVAKTEGTEGEDPVVGLCNGVVRRAIADGEIAADWSFLGTSPGRSARSVEELGPSSDPNAFYNKMVRYVQDAKNLADATGKSFSCWAYCWDQGESNYAGTTFTKSPYQYAQLMLALFDTLSKQVVAITGQEFQPYIFSYQVGGHRFYGVDKNTIALSQWRISRERPDFVLAVPVYAIPVVTDDVHLTNEGSWLLGEYRSRAMYQTMVRRSGKWRPLEPIKVDWQADHIDVKFHVPCGPLVLDTAICAQAVNMGFDVRESDAVVDIITSVTVVGDDTVRIAISREANATAVLTYARGRPTDPNKSGPVVGPRGNLRDSHGLQDTAVSPLGNTFALHNPCVMFQYSRATGF
ncbi:hypothetical protein [Pseudomonas juntendi]|uniref:Sialate O-acetylesterase domain-containing protein n=1 Tax=Pseudomonas juntendi TaxID=2666183 RepID=A0A7W2R0M1_9PSED|nr:hypothetical protein [Pseudomonas juntendi]MBA6149683.1 hypothetical protein [Pseudomonas juntendi]